MTKTESIQERNAHILLERFVYKKTYSELSKKFGITRERCRRICFFLCRKWISKTCCGTLFDLSSYLGEDDANKIMNILTVNASVHGLDYDDYRKWR